MPLTPATRLGSYEILAPLGAGGMREVDRARDTGWAERALIDHHPMILWARSLRFWDSIRSGPRFAEISRGIWANARD